MFSRHGFQIFPDTYCDIIIIIIIIYNGSRIVAKSSSGPTTRRMQSLRHCEIWCLYRSDDAGPLSSPVDRT
jgi:uncharacterized membrane protein